MKLTVLEASRHKYIFSSRLFLHWIYVFNYHWPVNYEVDLIRSKPPLRWFRSLIVGPEWHSSLKSDLSIMKLTVIEAVRHKHIFSSRFSLHWICDLIYHWPMDYYYVDGIRSRPPKHIFSSRLFLPWIFVFNHHWPVDYEVDGIGSRPP